MHSFDTTTALSELRRHDLLAGAESHRLATRSRHERSSAPSRRHQLLHLRSYRHRN